jgi:hypothetical protein
MASSPSHKFGQIVGNLIEDVMYPFLSSFAEQNNLYLDKSGKRGKARSGKNVSWTDKYGNKHDLDFVLERDGTNDVCGSPVAFIESAWRRYTKHSRNKVQEIQGAVLPLSETYAWNSPFLGAVIAGEFTAGSISQLKSVGFEVLYFTYNSIVEAFSQVNLDIRFDEHTPDDEFANCVQNMNLLNDDDWNSVKNHLCSIHNSDIDNFLDALNYSINCSIRKIIIIPLYGNSYEFTEVSQALLYLENDIKGNQQGELYKIEVIKKYNNGDKISGEFYSIYNAKKFINHS